MRLIRHLVSVAALAASTLGGAAVAGGSPAGAAGNEQDPTVDYVFEVEPGEDLEHWVDFALDEADVDEADRDDRVVGDFNPAINGARLLLTPREAMAIDGLRGTQGIRTTTRSWNFKAQWFADDVIATGTDGRVPAWPDQIIPAGIERVDAGLRDYSDSGIRVAVLDTGVDFFHQDLNVSDDGYNCTLEGGAADWQQDRAGHGTHVSGTIGALDNDRGVLGVAPGVEIVPIKVLGDDGSGSYASILCGIAEAMRLGVDAVNLSLGGTNEQSTCDSWDSLHTAICNAVASGIAVVVAAGNDGAPAHTKSPANYPEAITVSALATFGTERPGTNPPPFGGLDWPQADNEIAFFSNDGALVDVIEPGVLVLSTLPGDSYGVASGTSMATPHHAGLVAAALACGITVVDLHAFAVEYGADWGGDVDYDHEPLGVLPASCR